MATESAADTELSVTLSPPLSEWLEEQASALGVDRETLLVRILTTYHEVAEIDEVELEMLRSNRETTSQAELEDLNRQLAAVETDLSEHVSDLRSRILQLKEMVNSRADVDHDHAEIKTLFGKTSEHSTKIGTLDSDLSEAGSEIEELSSDIDTLETRVETIDTKLHQLARVVLEIKRRSGSNESLETIRRLANKNGTVTADCTRCKKQVLIGLLTESACPHCEQPFDDIDYPSTFRRLFDEPTLIETTGDQMEPDNE